MRTAVIILSVLILSLTACQSGDKAAATKPKPAPTVTVIRTPAPEIKTVTKEVTPQACLDALDSARKAFSLVSDFTDVVSEYPPLVGQAAQAGMTSDVAGLNRIVRKMRSINSRMDDINAQMDPSSFAGPAAECEASK
jgi:hypothetical protein